MKVVILYRPNSEHGRIVDEYVHDFQARTGKKQPEALSIDTREGAALASLYDVLQYPAILVIQDDGFLQKSWEGDQLPLMDEVAAYAIV